MKRRLLFHRDYRRFSGGHLKVFDYLRHAQDSCRFAPAVYLTPRSVSVEQLPSGAEPMASYDPASAHALFVAGLDWHALDAFHGIEDRVPVINLIQHVRHADSADPRSQFLSRRATRICVSEAVADAIQATGRCNGPIHVIPGGIDLTALTPLPTKAVEVFIAGLKQPTLATALAITLVASGVTVDCATAPLPRTAFLQRMGRARIAITLPGETEGLFLPALEAMALDCAVVCPDCIGNRDFCISSTTCLMPLPDLDALAAAATTLLADAQLSASLRAEASKAVVRHDLALERAAFLKILDGL
jgi:glycosyltransferase involved in cell wall biosynthesis